MTIETITGATSKVCAGLPNLVGGYFEKEEMLLAKGLQAFRPGLRFTEDFAANKEELDEYKRFLIESKKSSVGRSSYNAEWYNKMLSEARAKFLITQDSLDDEPTEFKRHLAKMRWLEPVKLHSFKQPYKDEVARLWLQDVEQFSSHQWHGLGFDKAADRKKLYINIFKSWEKKLGFTLDKQLSTSRKPVMTKPLVAPWKLCFMIDTVYFYKPVDSDMIVHEGSITYRIKPGPTLEASFGLIYDKVQNISKLQYKECLLHHFDMFYPIHLLDITAQLYRKFYNLEELDAIVNIHLTLYELMQSEFENALAKGLSS
jgi:hypothetical protein